MKYLISFFDDMIFKFLTLNDLDMPL